MLFQSIPRGFEKLLRRCTHSASLLLLLADRLKERSTDSCRADPALEEELCRVWMEELALVVQHQLQMQELVMLHQLHTEELLLAPLCRVAVP